MWRRAVARQTDARAKDQILFTFDLSFDTRRSVSDQVRVGTFPFAIEGKGFEVVLRVFGESIDGGRQFPTRDWLDDPVVNLEVRVGRVEDHVP